MISEPAVSILFSNLDLSDSAVGGRRSALQAVKLPQPAAISSQPAAVSGQPAAVSGQPAAISGQPAAVSGQPAEGGGDGHRDGGGPEAGPGEQQRHQEAPGQAHRT